MTSFWFQSRFFFLPFKIGSSSNSGCSQWIRNPGLRSIHTCDLNCDCGLILLLRDCYHKKRSSLNFKKYWRRYFNKKISNVNLISMTFAI
jgi:hypothetical protein